MVKNIPENNLAKCCKHRETYVRTRIKSVTVPFLMRLHLAISIYHEVEQKIQLDDVRPLFS